MKTVKRVFFEQGNNIQVLGEILDQGPERPLCANFEYLDFKALPNLIAVHQQAFLHGQKMLVTELPDSVEAIRANAFGYMQKCEITQLPINLKQIFDAAFRDCPGLKAVDINRAAGLENIGNWAFADCSNLTIPDETILYAKEIGEGAFSNCTSLVLNFATAEQSQIKIIYKQAFKNSARGLQNLPPNIEKLGAHCFSAELRTEVANEMIGCSILPDTLIAIDSGVFQGRSSQYDTWILNVENPADITINELAFEGIKNLKYISVPWELNDATFELHSNLKNGWTISGSIEVINS